MIAENRCARMLTCIAALGMMISPVFGVTPVENTRSKVFDVKLAAGKQLLGQAVTANGKPAAGAQVVLLSETKPIAQTRTDQRGRFVAPVPKSGVYRVVVADRSFTIRAWRPEVSPPAAKLGLLCVTENTVRGQCGTCSSASSCDCGPDPCACGPDACAGGCGAGGGCFGGGHHLKSILTNPVVIGLGVATAIALPIALSDDDDDDKGPAEPAS